MVPLCLGNDWWSISGTLGVYAFYSNYFRYEEETIGEGLGRVNNNIGPRFALVGLWYLLTARPNASLPKFVAAMGLFRTLTCGGWTYVTSTDDHDWHDIFMISYIVATLPWTLGCIALSPSNGKAAKYRKYLASSFFGTLVPLIYFFIQHKVHKIAGGEFANSNPWGETYIILAYTTYAFFEWTLVLLDVAFDAVTALDFEAFELVIKDVKGSSKGYVRWLPKWSVYYMYFGENA